MDRDELLEFLIENEAIFADGFEGALVGYTARGNSVSPLAVYSQDECIQILIERDGMSEEEAVEFFEFNVVGSWVGEKTPVFVLMAT